MKKFRNKYGITFYAEKHTREEWKDLVGDKGTELWDYELKDLLTGLIEIKEGELYFKIRERYFETGVTLS